MYDSFATPWTAAHQASLSTEFSRQEHGSGLLFPSPGELPNPGIEPTSPALIGRFFTTAPPGKLWFILRRREEPLSGPHEVPTHPESLQGDKMSKSCAGHACLHGASWCSEPVRTPGLEGIEEQSYPLKMM